MDDFKNASLDPHLAGEFALTLLEILDRRLRQILKFDITEFVSCRFHLATRYKGTMTRVRPCHPSGVSNVSLWLTRIAAMALDTILTAMVGGVGFSSCYLRF